MSLPEPVLHRTGEGRPSCSCTAGVDRSFWDDVARARRREVLTYDFRGTGRRPPAEPYTSRTSPTRRGPAGRRGHTRVDVVGVSLGGLVALRLAADNPDLVRRLVVVDAVAVYPQPMREMWRDRAARAPVEGLEPFLDPTLGLWFTADRVAEGGPVVEAVRRAFLAGARGYALACRALEQADVTGVLDRITAPTLVVCGEDDAPPFTAAAREFGERLPTPAWCLSGAARRGARAAGPVPRRPARLPRRGPGRGLPMSRDRSGSSASASWGRR